MIRVTCSCGRIHELPHDLDGRKIRCSCGRLHRVRARSADARRYDTVRYALEKAWRSLLLRASQARYAITSAMRTPLALAVAAGVFLAIGSVIGYHAGRSDGQKSLKPLVRPPEQTATVAVGGDVATPRPSSSARVTSSVTAAQAPSPDMVPPATGTYILPRRTLGGRGELKVENGTEHDAVIQLVRLSNAGRRTYCKIYVRALDLFTVESIPDGGYEVRFASGDGWISSETRFKSLSGLQKFEDRFDFRVRRSESADGVETHWTTYSITLHPVPYGTARTVEISSAEFNADD